MLEIESDPADFPEITLDLPEFLRKDESFHHVCVSRAHSGIESRVSGSAFDDMDMDRGRAVGEVDTRKAGLP